MRGLLAIRQGKCQICDSPIRSDAEQREREGVGGGKRRDLRNFPKSYSTSNSCWQAKFAIATVALPICLSVGSETLANAEHTVASCPE